MPTNKFNELEFFRCRNYVRLFYRLCDITHCEQGMARVSLLAIAAMGFNKNTGLLLQGTFALLPVLSKGGGWSSQFSGI